MLDSASKRNLVVVTEDNAVFTDIPATSKGAEIVKVLRERTGREYILYHLGQRLSKIDIVHLEDTEDFVLAIRNIQPQQGPMLDASNEQHVR
jgi:hypothetical protein